MLQSEITTPIEDTPHSYPSPCPSLEMEGELCSVLLPKPLIAFAVYFCQNHELLLKGTYVKTIKFRSQISQISQICAVAVVLSL